jgi:hypothetical protein
MGGGAAEVKMPPDILTMQKNYPVSLLQAYLAVDSMGAGFYSNYVFRPSNARVACCCCMCRLACG